MAATADAHVVSEEISKSSLTESDRGGALDDVAASNGDEHEIESVGAEDALEEVRNRRKPVRRHYKIQEVIKRRQILLVQVVKEERGNKGAALTTYLSLAGRYSVLMPNTARGGGISRKITNAQDRKRLKEVVQDLDVPQGMGVILRTAGESRTKAEIKRDYEYLMRLWETVRTLTLQSTAPALVYEEGSLIKRSVRDLYNKDIDEVQVSGEDGYREAKDFMRMLMPSHAKVVQPYRDTTPIFVRNGIEAQLDRMLQPQVTLKSGGYIIINQTEALVSIDVNSGRSTREHSIEDTALQTNLEAAEEAFGDVDPGTFFDMVREDTIEGMFADPLYGGNRGLVGWTMVGYPGVQRSYSPREMKGGTAKRPQSLDGLHPMSPDRPDDHARHHGVWRSLVAVVDHGHPDRCPAAVVGGGSRNRFAGFAVLPLSKA
jgi:ribonuclease E